MASYPELSRRRRAIHEAGHAAVCFEVGIGVNYVVVRDDGGGYCKHEDAMNARLEYEFPAWGERFLLTILGGMAAEERFAAEHGLPPGPEHLIAWSEDQRLFQKGMACMVMHGLVRPGDEPAEFRRLREVVQVMVAGDGVWAGINAIADELLLHERITGVRAEEVYRVSHSDG